MKIDENSHGMRQDFTNAAMVEVPEIMGANAGHGKTFGQVRADRFDFLAQPRAELEQGRTVRRRHPFARRGHYDHAVPFRQHCLAEGIDKALMGYSYRVREEQTPHDLR